MATPAALAPALLARAHADQVAQLYAGWHRTTASMLLGAALLCFVLWGQASPAWMAAWVALIVANQAWRGLLVRAWTRARPGIDATGRWGRYWSAGSTLAGGLWGLAALGMYPASPPHQALLIVCVFGAVLGGLNLTAVYRPAFYGFALPALVPLIARVAVEGDAVHLYTALVMAVVLAFILAFGVQLNGLMTRSLAMRYENVDLIAELKGRTRAADDARAAAEAANRTKSQLLAAASHDLRQPLHALGLYIAALAARAAGALPTVDGLLSPDTRARQTKFLSQFTALAHRAGLRPQLAETNSVAREGREGVTNSFGAALWTVDYLMTAARLGVTGVNLHNQVDDCQSYPVFCFGSPAAKRSDTAQVNPNYYGTLMVHQMVGGAILPVTVDAGGASITAHAVRMGDGSVKVIVDNLDRAFRGRIVVNVAGGSAGDAEVARLTAPSPDALSGTRYAAATVTAAGGFTPRATERANRRSGRYRLPLTTPSALLMTVR